MKKDSMFMAMILFVGIFVFIIWLISPESVIYVKNLILDELYNLLNAIKIYLKI